MDSHNLSRADHVEAGRLLVVPVLPATAAGLLQAPAAVNKAAARMWVRPRRNPLGPLPEPMACRSAAGVAQSPSSSRRQRWRPAPAWRCVHQLRRRNLLQPNPATPPKQPRPNPPRQHPAATTAPPQHCRHHHPQQPTSRSNHSRRCARLTGATIWPYPGWIFTTWQPLREAARSRPRSIIPGPSSSCSWR